LAAWPAGAQDCRLALVLALDVSSSVDEVEYDLQRVGLAAALDAPEVRHAILSRGVGAVAFSAYEWSGRHKQKILLDWTVLRTDGDIDRAVEALAGSVRSETEFPTAMGYGIGYAARMLSRAPLCDRRVVDVSGDGVNNDGFGPRIAYRHFPLGDVTVNGLVILGHDAEVVGFYRDQVIRGRNAFLETANGFEDFRNAMTRKLYREINDIMLGGAIPSEPRG
jgi:hypothetical protein